MTRPTIGLLLGTEDDWPTAFTEILRRLGPVEGPGGPHTFDVERITIEPFSLRDKPRYDLVIARLTPKGYEEIDRTHLLEPTLFSRGRDVVWSYPAFASRCLFARNDKEIICVELAK